MAEQSLSGVISPKRLNAASTVTFGWDVEAFTTTDIMEATGLTRTTVISLCDELVDLGWLVRREDARLAGEYTKGRPAHRYSLNASAGYVVGLDAAVRGLKAIVVDMRGHEISRATYEYGEGRISPHNRIEAADDVVAQAMAAAMVTDDEVLCMAIGVPAPTDSEGESPRGNMGYWKRMNPGFAKHFRARFSTVLVENDAILATTAEGSNGVGATMSSYITFLVKDGLGAGLMVDGHPVRGFHGAAGELWVLGHLRGSSKTGGLDHLMAQFAVKESASVWEAIAEYRDPMEMWTRLATLAVSAADSSLAGMTFHQITAARVVSAAEEGDRFAAEVVEQTAAYLADMCIVVGGLLDVEGLIFSGVDEVLYRVIERASELVADGWNPEFAPPAVVVSGLGDDVVAHGATIYGLGSIRTQLADIVCERAPGRHAEKEPAWA